MEQRTFWRGYLRSRSGPLGLALLAAVALVAALASVLTPLRPEQFADALLAPPGPGHPFGTDHLGRDIFAGVVYGTRVSLLLGVAAAAISGVVGTVLGAVAGYAGGWIDEVLSRLIDVFLMIPVFFLVLVVIMLFGNDLPYVMTVIGLTIWPTNARLMRAQALSLRQRTFVRAAVALGQGHGAILRRHVIPHGIYPIVANTTLQVAAAILTEAGLSFLGLGDPNVVS
ncbi:MAG TPA: ABC transporter permease, partial [Bacillota bacterium]